MPRPVYESDDLFVPASAVQAELPPGISLPPARFFPPPTATTPEGLVCFGGRLSPEWLVDAYTHGIFPWPMWDDEPIAWWSPDPRTIIEVDGLRLSTRLRRTIRRGRFIVTCDRDFAGVIYGCATADGRAGETWLTPSMIDAYTRLHRLGHAHSVEAWCSKTATGLHPSLCGRGDGGEGPHAEANAPHAGRLPRDEGTVGPLPRGEGMTLAGGVYGVSIGGLFAAESMFYRERDASKVALAHLVNHLRQRGFGLLDIQQWTPHTGRLGAIDIPRKSTYSGWRRRSSYRRRLGAN